MIRNAGGRAFDAIRTMSVLQTIGHTKTVVIMHHNGGLTDKNGRNKQWLTQIYMQIAE